VDRFFAWLAAQAARILRKSELGSALGEATACMLRREEGFRVPGLARPDRGPRSPSLLEAGRVDIDSNLVENATRSPAIHRRNALFAPSRDFAPAKTLPGNGS
jgi:transposase